MGFGVSAVPNRLVDLETTVIDEDHIRVWHDLDRLAVTVFLNAVDITIGSDVILETGPQVHVNLYYTGRFNNYGTIQGVGTVTQLTPTRYGDFDGDGDGDDIDD